VFPTYYKCAHCSLYQWETPGAVIVGGVHLCYVAIVTWLALTEDDNDPILTLEVAQLSRST